MTSSPPARRRTRLAGVSVVACAVVASSLTPSLAGSASAATALPAPSVVSPTDSGPVAKEVVLDWTDVAGAKGYRVQVGTDDEWSDDPTFTVDSVASRFTLPAWLPHASYVWRVAALGDSAQSRWATGGTFTRGWLSTPQGLSTTVSAWVPTFRWEPVPTASEYQLQVSNSPFFNDRAPTQGQALPVTEGCFTTRTELTPYTGQRSPKSNPAARDCTFTLLDSGEVRYWRVRALDHVVDGTQVVDTTPVVDEGISHLPPAEMDKLDTTACPAPPPAAGSTAAPGVGGTAPSPSASPTGSPQPSTSPTAAPAPEAPKTTPCEPKNNVEKGAWSAPATFVTTYDQPASDDTRRYAALPVITPKPVTDEPLCDAQALCRDFPTLRWEPVAGADWYRVYVALDGAYSNIQEIAETPGTSWTPNAQWRESTSVRSYFYAVQPCTTTGTTPGCGPVPNDPASFRKSSPKLATTDVGAAGPIGRDVLLSWQSHADAMKAAGVPATSEAYAYRVQVTTESDPDFVGALVDDAEVDATHHVSPDKTYPDGTLLWRVQAVDASGHRLPWSPVRSFVHDATAPTFTVSPLTALPVGGAVKVLFSEPVTGVSAATVSVGGTLSAVALSADGRTATVTPQVRLLPGVTVPVSVSAGVRDLAGNAAAPAATPVRVDPLVDDRHAAMGLGGSWQRLVASNAVNGTYSRSVPLPRRQTAATVALYGRGAEVKGCVGPANGVIELWADGIRLTRIDTYRSYSGCGVVLTRAPFKSGDGAHRIQVRGVGVKNARSKGTAVAIDAITAVK